MDDVADMLAIKHGAENDVPVLSFPYVCPEPVLAK
jgi:hypothetical protein